MSNDQSDSMQPGPLRDERRRPRRRRRALRVPLDEVPRASPSAQPPADFPPPLSEHPFLAAPVIEADAPPTEPPPSNGRGDFVDEASAVDSVRPEPTGEPVELQAAGSVSNFAPLGIELRTEVTEDPELTVEPAILEDLYIEEEPAVVPAPVSEATEEYDLASLGVIEGTTPIQTKVETKEEPLSPTAVRVARVVALEGSRARTSDPAETTPSLQQAYEGYARAAEEAEAPVPADVQDHGFQAEASRFEESPVETTQASAESPAAYDAEGGTTLAEVEPPPEPTTLPGELVVPDSEEEADGEALRLDEVETDEYVAPTAPAVTTPPRPPEREAARSEAAPAGAPPQAQATAVVPETSEARHAPPEPPAAAPVAPKPKKKRRFWFEHFFDDDYLRTVRAPTTRQVARQCDFITQQLGLPPGATILDVGCGLGLHAIELATRGYRVVALDLSASMLHRAADEAQDRGVNIPFLQGDMRAMSFDVEFDAAICIGTSFGYFDDEGNRRAIERLYRSIKPTGLLLLDVVNRDHVIRSQPNLVWFEGDGCVVMEETQFNYITSRLEVKRTVIADNGRQRETNYSVRLYSLHELGQILHQQGFRVAEVSGREATPGVHLGADSPRMIILAQRRGLSLDGSPDERTGKIPTWSTHPTKGEGPPSQQMEALPPAEGPPSQQIEAAPAQSVEEPSAPASSSDVDAILSDEDLEET